MLREIRPEDVSILFGFQADPEANAMAAFPARTEPAFREHLGRVLANPAVIARAIVAGDVVVGQIGSWDAEGARNVGYWVGREHWGKGYATAALRELVAIDPVRPLWARWPNTTSRHNAFSSDAASYWIGRCKKTSWYGSTALTEEFAIGEYLLTYGGARGGLQSASGRDSAVAARRAARRPRYHWRALRVPPRDVALRCDGSSTGAARGRPDRG